LTRVGQQIAKILQRDPIGALRRAAGNMLEAETIDLFGPKIVQLGSNSVSTIMPIERLKGPTEAT